MIDVGLKGLSGISIVIVSVNCAFMFLFYIL